MRKGGDASEDSATPQTMVSAEIQNAAYEHGAGNDFSILFDQEERVSVVLLCIFKI